MQCRVHAVAVDGVGRDKEGIRYNKHEKEKEYATEERMGVTEKAQEG